MLGTHLFVFQDVTPPDSLRVVTYNILADLYADTEANMHSQCPKNALALSLTSGTTEDIQVQSGCDFEVYHPTMHLHVWSIF